MVAAIYSMYLISQISANYSKVIQSSAQCKDWSRYSLSCMNSHCHSPATNFFMVPSTLVFEPLTIIKVSIHCRKDEKHHYLQFSNGWSAEIWDTCSLMKIGWKDLKELIFLVVYCIQNWRTINLWRTREKSIHCKSMSFPFRKGVQYSERAEKAFKSCFSFSLYHGDLLTVWSTGMNFSETSLNWNEVCILLEVPSLAIKSCTGL